MPEPIFVQSATFQALAAKGQASVGAFTYGRPEILWWGEDASIVIGKYCSIADGVRIFLGGNHRTEWVTTYPFSAFDSWPEAQEIVGHPATRGSVIIGSDVWIGAGATIMSGIEIGHGAVIGAMAVVTRNVSPYAIVAGNPTRILRYRFTEEIIARLLTIAWWDRSAEEVRRLIPLIMSSNVQAIIAACGVHDQSPSIKRGLRQRLREIRESSIKRLI